MRHSSCRRKRPNPTLPYGVRMSMLKHVDRIAMLSLLSAFLGIPAAALACSAATAQSAHPAARVALPGGGESRFYTTAPPRTETHPLHVSPPPPLPPPPHAP